MASVDEITADLSILFALAETIKAELDALKAAGQGATQAQLDAIDKLIDDETAKLSGTPTPPTE